MTERNAPRQIPWPATYKGQDTQASDDLARPRAGDRVLRVVGAYGITKECHAKSFRCQQTSGPGTAMGYVRRAGRPVIESPAGRQLPRVHKGPPAAQTGIHVVGGRDDLYDGRIGAQDIVALGSVPLETHGLLVQRLFPATVVAGHARLGDHKHAEQTERGNLHCHGTFQNRSDFAIFGYTQLMKNVISADRSDYSTRGMSAQGKKCLVYLIEEGQ